MMPLLATLWLFAGVFLGLLIAILTVATLTYFRRPIESKLSVVEKRIANAGPRPKGFIVEPLDDAEEVRRQIIERNQREGRETRISELV